MGEAQRFLSAQGFAPPSTVVDKASKASTVAEGAFNQAKPSITSSLTNLSSKDPGTLAEYALAAVALYYLVRVADPWVMKESLLFGAQKQGEAYLVVTQDLASAQDLDRGTVNQVNLAGT